MLVGVRFVGIVGDYVGCDRAQAGLHGGAVMDDLMDWLDERFGAQWPAEVWDRRSRRFEPFVLVFLDGKDVSDYSQALGDGSEVACVSMMAGGACSKSCREWGESGFGARERRL